MVCVAPIQSTALSHGVPDVGDFVYFQEHDEKPWIRIGRTDRENGRENAQSDFLPIAMIQGCYDDEQALHKHFNEWRVSRRNDRSTYEGDEVYDYVEWLLLRGHAGRDRAEAERLPSLPFSVWSPRGRRNEGRDGVLSLFTQLPPRERLAYARSDLAHLSSESDDWYTPADIIEAARRTMGRIDTDPATCIAAQRTIEASHWYTKAQDGLRTDLPWCGAVWLNPPYGRGESSAATFVARLLRELEHGNVIQAVTCLNLASASALWFQPVWTHAALHLVYRNRPNFWQETATDSSPTKGVILSYFGSRTAAFVDAFQPMGVIVSTIKGVP